MTINLNINQTLIYYGLIAMFYTYHWKNIYYMSD